MDTQAGKARKAIRALVLSIAVTAMALAMAVPALAYEVNGTINCSGHPSQNAWSKGYYTVKAGIGYSGIVSDTGTPYNPGYASAWYQSSGVTSWMAYWDVGSTGRGARCSNIVP